MPSFIEALLSRIYRSTKLSNYLAWLEAADVGFTLPRDKTNKKMTVAFNIKLIYTSQVCTTFLKRELISKCESLVFFLISY